MRSAMRAGARTAVAAARRACRREPLRRAWPGARALAGQKRWLAASPDPDRDPLDGAEAARKDGGHDNRLPEGSRVMLIDGWALLFRQYHGMSNISNGLAQEHLERNIATSFFRKVSQVIKYSNPTHVSVIFDGFGARRARQKIIAAARTVAEQDMVKIEAESSAAFSVNVASTLQQLQADVDMLESISARCQESIPPEVHSAPLSTSDEGALSEIQQNLASAMDRLTHSLEEKVPKGSEPELKALSRLSSQLDAYCSTAEKASAHADASVAAVGNEYMQGLQIFVRLLSAYADSVEHFSREAVEATEEAVRKFEDMNNFPEYKAHREQPPEGISAVFNQALDRFEKVAIHTTCLPNLEADDIIATLAVQATAQGAMVDIVSSDKDFFQLINPSTRVLRPSKTFAFPREAPLGEYGAILARAFDIVDESRFEEIFPGLKPAQHVDYMSLVGDAADNIPGIKGVGPKTALQLVQKHGCLDDLVRNLRGLAKQKKNEKVILDNLETLYFGRELVTLISDLKLSPGVRSWPTMRRPTMRRK